MGIEDEFADKGFGSKTDDLYTSTSDAAMRVAQGAMDQAPDVRKRVTDAAARARREARRVSENGDQRRGPPLTVSVYGQVQDFAQTGYRAAENQVATSPLTSLAVATLIGAALGWALRGAREENRRRDLLAVLPAYLRRRAG